MSETEAGAPEPKDAGPSPWTVKGMTMERRDAINAAARRHKMTVAEYLWASHEGKTRDDRVPMASPTTGGRGVNEGIPWDDIYSHSGASHARALPAPSSVADELTKLGELAIRMSGKDIPATDTVKAVRKAIAAAAVKISNS